LTSFLIFFFVKLKEINMKLSLATLAFAAPAAAFAPTNSFGVRSALKMSTETSEEKVSLTSVRFRKIDR